MPSDILSSISLFIICGSTLVHFCSSFRWSLSSNLITCFMFRFYSRRSVPSASSRLSTLILSIGHSHSTLREWMRSNTFRLHDHSRTNTARSHRMYGRGTRQLFRNVSNSNWYLLLRQSKWFIRMQWSSQLTRSDSEKMWVKPMGHLMAYKYLEEQQVPIFYVITVL